MDCEADDPIHIPADLDAVCEEARKALRVALASGKRGLRVEAGVPALDISSRAYEPVMMARFALEVTAALTMLEGPILLLLPGLAAVTEARQFLDAGIWSDEARERLQVSPLSLHSAPESDDEANIPAAVVIGGLTLMEGSSSEDTAFRNARAWLRLSSVSSCVSVCLNTRVRLLPAELTEHETVFALIPYVLNRQPASAQDDGEQGEDAGRALLWRSFPDPWRVLLDASSTGEYSVLAELDRRPDDAALSRLLLPTVEKRKVALDSAMRALGELGGDEGAGDAAGAAAGGGARPSDDAPSNAAATAAGSASFAVALTWEDIMGDNNCALALYQASTLLRQQALGRAVTFAADEAAVHVVLPSETEDAVAAKVRDPSYKLTGLTGDLHGACLLRTDGAGRGIALIEQLALPAAHADEERAAFAQSLLRCAKAEAAARGQTHLVIGLPSHPREWFAGVGFEEPNEAAPPEVSTAMERLTSPVWQRLRGGARVIRRARAGTARTPPRAKATCSEADATRDGSPFGSLSDAVGGVHGGKYQFGARGDAGFQGAAFAEALAMSGGDPSDGAAHSDGLESEPWPSWATMRKGRSLVEGDVSLSGGASCTVTNAYRTWERFYASILPADDARFTVSPSSGWLAPKGGANNVCDPAKPYSDTVRVCLEVRPGATAEGGAEAHVLVRTEEEQWLFAVRA